MIKMPLNRNPLLTSVSIVKVLSS